MKSQRLLCVSVVVLLVVCMIVPVMSSAQTKPASGTKAGSITALLPVATIDRGTGRNKTTVEAKKGDDVVWNDLVKTQKGGRARITLTDTSVLSLGSQAELRILKHDSRTQQTALQLAYGRVRAEVASVTRDGGKFELRTPTAVAGVIGTDFGTDSSIPGVTTFLCIAGIVTVGNVDAKVPGTVPCPAGSTTSVSTGLPPTPPKPATQEQIQKLIQDTSAAVISSISPASAFQGKTLVAAVSGTKMTGISEVTISGAGVTVSLPKPSTETSLEISLQIAADAPAGPRTINFTKSNGQSASSIFTVLAPPKEGAALDIPALQKAYLDIIEQERLSEIAGLNAIGIGVQQSAGETLAMILEENKKNTNPLDQDKIEQHMAQDMAPMLTALDAAGKKVNEDTANAAKDFVTKTTPKPPVPADFAKVLKDTFEKVNAALLERFKLTHDALGKEALATNAKFVGTPDWLKTLQSEANVQKINPKSDADERALDQGLIAAFDASRSKGSGNSSIAGFNWVLCDPSYKPQQVGVPLPANDSKCHPLSGYASNASDFRFQTCNLTPQDYIVRVFVVDDKQKSAAMDMRLRVLKGEYEDPTTRLQSAAAAFQSLQSERFMAFFDTSFANYGSLSETMRRTFEGLASMTINLRVSQASINCNEATVRADWQQNYTFKADQTCDNLPAGTSCQRVVFTQTEQLTSRMIRVADASGSRILGWNIVDFQGDNGTVQGTPPGPRTVDVALPDLEIVGLQPVQGGRAAREGGAIAQGIAPGPNAFEAVVRNLGTGPLSAPAKIRFVALGPNNVEVASDVEDVPIPLSIGGSVSILGRMNIPDLGAGIPVRITATVNPGCVVPEKNCDGSNIQLLDLLIGIIDLKLSNVTQVGTLIGTLPGAVTVDITNIGSRISVASVNNLKVGPAANNLVSAGVSVPAIAPGQTVTINVPFTVPNASGAQAIVAGLSPGSQFDFNSANDFATGSINIIAAKVDLQLSNLAFSAGTPVAPPFASGQSHAVSFNVKNVGNVASAVSDNYSCKLVSPTFGTRNFTPVTLPPVGAGLTLTGLTFTFVVPIDFTGANTLTCAASQDTFEAAATLTDNQASLAAQINPNIDLQLVNVPVPTSADQMGGNSSVSFGVKNFGLDTAPSGYSVVLTINGNPVTTTTGPSVAGGATAPITINYVNPQIGSAPQDITVPASLQVNANAVVTETNTANNTVSRTLRLVDFVLSTIPTGPLAAVAGRSFNSTVIQVLPTTYPLPLNVFYPGAPAGLTNAGSQSANILGTQLGSNNITGAPGPYTITPTATVQGVTHNGSNITVQLGADIAMSLGTAFALNATGSPQPFQVAVTGGVYPVTLTLTLPTGVTIAAGSPIPTISTVITAPSTVTWSLQAGVTAAIGGALTNIIVTATDPGIGANNVGAGNKVFAPPYSIGGFDNYIVTGATMSAPHTAGTGNDSFQVGETVTFQVGVKNIGNLGQTGVTPVQIICTPSCGTQVISIPAPAPGITNFGNLVLPVTLSPGSYMASVSIQSPLAPNQSTFADDSLAPFPFDVFDFSVSNTLNFAPYQNVPLNGSGNFGIFVNESGPAASIPIALPMTVTSTGSTGINAPSIVQGGLSYSIAMFKNAGVISGTLDTVTATVSRTGFPGFTRTASQPIKYFTASLDNTTSGALGDSSATHQILPVGGGGVTLTFHLTGDFDATTAGTIAVNTTNGITTQVNSFTGTPGNTFDVVFTPAAAGGTIANGTETVIDLVYTVPNTNPVQQIVKHVYFLPVNPPDLAVSMIPAGISTGRDFGSTANPWISGEGIEFNVTVSNIAAGASSPNLAVKLFLSSTLLSQTTIPSIPGNSSTTFLVHVRAPEPVGTAGGNSIFLQVDNDPLELLSTLGNNFASVPIATSDWSLVLVGAPSGDSANPITMPTNTLGGTVVKAVAASGGLIVTPITVLTAGISSTISATAPAGALTPFTAGQPPQGNVSFSTGLNSGAGQYAVQLVGRVSDGGVTSQRPATVHINVLGTVTPVTISSSINNAMPSNPPSPCSGPCVIRQINGYLVDSLDLTATGGTGTVDLIFTDDNSIVSNVSVPSGTPGPQYLNAVPYNSPRTINFAPLDNNGLVTPGPANVVVSAAAVTTAARGGPIQEPVGTQQTTLYFNIGDLDVSPTIPCSIQIAPNGGTAHIVMSFLPNHGFNQSSLIYNWTSFGGAFVTLAQSNSGTSTFLNPGYTTATFDFTNHEVSNINSMVTFNLDVTIQSVNGSQATKHFAIPVSLSSAPCIAGSARREGLTANAALSSGGYWTRGTGGGPAAASIRREAASATSTLPDLQIKSTDVSISPSVPKSGDKIDVRFKVTNAGGGIAKQVPIALQVNGVTVASDKYDLGAGASTLAALQWVAKVPDPNIQLDRSRRSPRGGGDNQDAPTPPAPNANGPGSGFDAKLVIDPAGTVPQASATFKAVQLSRMMLRGGPAEPTTIMPMDRVFLEVGTICVGFRLSSGSGSECESGADVDLSIVDFSTSRFEMIAQLGIADLGPVSAGAANLAGAQFSSRASLIVGHTYAVQLAGNKVGLMTIVRQLTPMQLAAEAKRRFGRSAIRIVSRLGGSTGAVEAGDVSGVARAGSDALTYFELAFTTQQ